MSNEAGLKVAEVAARVRVTTECVRRWVHSGQLQATRLGLGPNGQYRIQPSALAAFLERRA